MKQNFYRDAILGALVADAASLGMHWVYDQSRIKQLAPQAPEFTRPCAETYQGNVGFFAHKGKQIGDCSHYGEQLLTLLDALSSNRGIYSKSKYEDSFRAAFGYGGTYSGYIDHPTRDTLDNFSRAERLAIERAKAIPFDGGHNDQHMMITKALGNLKIHEGEQRYQSLENAVRQTHNDDKTVAYAFQLLKELESIDGYHGADDEQLPAISKLPALLAARDGITSLNYHAESAIRVTNHNDQAVHYGQLAVNLLSETCAQKTFPEALARAKANTTAAIADIINEVTALLDKDTCAVTEQFGTSCNLAYGIPSIIHNILTTKSYQSSIRKNIYAGGDCCGRSILLGAVLGGTYGIGGEKGIPESWIHQVNKMPLIEQQLKGLLSIR